MAALLSIIFLRQKPPSQSFDSQTNAGALGDLSVFCSWWQAESQLVKPRALRAASSRPQISTSFDQQMAASEETEPQEGNVKGRWSQCAKLLVQGI